MFYIGVAQGYVGEKKPVHNVRFARPFTSFDEADDFAKSIGLLWYAVLRACAPGGSPPGRH